jgi:hypothetical protein
MEFTEYEEYLQPTKLCDFDKVPEIKEMAKVLTSGLSDIKQKSDRILHFTKNILYQYDDCDLSPENSYTMR